MMKALSPNAGSVQGAIKHKISQTLSTYGLTDKASRIMDIYYHGAGSHFMITVGYAINFEPKFAIVKENWVKVKKSAKASSSKASIKIDWEGVKKEAMKVLADAGWENDKIAHALNTQVGKVSGVISWYEHRDSWVNGTKKVAKKVAKKKKK